MNSKEQKIPQRVLRFYGKIDYALECIALKQITFLHLEKLNDPFDPVLDYVTDFNDNYADLLSYVEERYPAQIALFKERMPEKNWQRTVAEWSKQADELRKTMFVFSTCEVKEGNHPRDNLYMWGHYGNGHRGVAIEFDTSVLGESCMKQGAPDSESPWWKMIYENKIPKIKCEDIIKFVLNTQPGTDNLESNRWELMELIRRKVRTKGKVWAMENEWRLVLKNDETKLKFCRRELLDNAITVVYLGCRAAEQEYIQNDFVYETQRHFPSASVFRGKMMKREYTLDFEKIVV